MPLRHAVFRHLWSANLVISLGLWMQNTGAGWLMTTLSPDAFHVSLVQAATIVPVFLLALPAGALADIIDRRRFMIGTQVWMMAFAALLALLTATRVIGADGLVALTFAIGIGSAMYQPAWGATVPEIVPRDDLVQAISLNGIGFNIARALGPALGGVLVLVGGASFNFTLFALSFLVGITVLATWRRPSSRRVLPREHLVSAMAAGIRFARHTPAMRSSMARSIAYFLPASATWSLLPLIVRVQLGLDAGSFGLLLGLMGVGGVTSGMLLPLLRGRAGRGATVFGASVVSAAGMGLIASTHHWAPAALGMLLFGVGWVAAASLIQASAQLSCPPWVRARGLAIYQFSFNGALAVGAFVWGWVGNTWGLRGSMAIAAGSMLVLSVAIRGFTLDGIVGVVTPRPMPKMPSPEPVAAVLAPQLPEMRGRIMEMMRYHVVPERRDEFLAVMSELRHARGRTGALGWQLYEDLAHPDGWIEQWFMQNWTDHLREATRLSDEDNALIGRAAGFADSASPLPCRFLAVGPHGIQLAWRNAEPAPAL